MKKRILVLGATGSVGHSALTVIEKENYELVGFSYNKNTKLAKKIKNKFPTSLIFSPSINEINNVNSFDQLLDQSKPDIVLNAIVGFEGLEKTILVIEKQYDLALANKESLVIAGWLINDLLKQSKSKFFPVDSEHSSLYDILKNNSKEVKELILTCSGGPFFYKQKEELKNASFNDAIKHPNWNMGYKISVDSATMMNKCFEIIEAFYLFNTKNIKVVQHKQSIVHSLVKFTDNSYFACMSTPDMKLAIQQGISGFTSGSQIIQDLNFNNLNLNFNEIDLKTWLPIKWAYDFLKNNKRNIPIVLNAANDVCIELFKNNKINFLQINLLIEKTLNHFKKWQNVKNLDDIKKLNNQVRVFINSLKIEKCN
ncbi:MAG: hypothetical protein K2I76_03050 [Malacoplasma sp.]|nr:hypothetical protein [Malacoplasma sp.]